MSDEPEPVTEEPFWLTVIYSKGGFAWGLNDRQQLLKVDGGCLRQVEDPADVYRNQTVVVKVLPSEVRTVFTDEIAEESA